MLKKFTNKKGFTLMEMLIVVAIIAILVAIAIPTFNNQLDKSRQAADIANIRVAYAEASLDAIEKGGAGEATSVAMTHSGTFEKLDSTKIGDKDIKKATVTKGTAVKVKIDDKGVVTFEGLTLAGG